VCVKFKKVGGSRERVWLEIGQKRWCFSDGFGRITLGKNSLGSQAQNTRIGGKIWQKVWGVLRQKKRVGL